ncbi:hypothetical protein BaRGS_00033795, partial [Batillaria attramentaria]
MNEENRRSIGSSRQSKGSQFGLENNSFRQSKSRNNLHNFTLTQLQGSLEGTR